MTSPIARAVNALIANPTVGTVTGTVIAAGTLAAGAHFGDNFAMDVQTGLSAFGTAALAPLAGRLFGSANVKTPSEADLMVLQMLAGSLTSASWVMSATTFLGIVNAI